MLTIGRLIRQERLAAGMTQEALAGAIGCSKPQLSLMENDQRRVSAERVSRIEAALGIDDGRLSAALQWNSTPPQIRARVTASDAFAQEHLGRDRALGELDPARLNINGGAIAIGHPVGMTGTRLLLTLAHELQVADAELGLATLCIGGGQGSASIFERVG